MTHETPRHAYGRTLDPRITEPKTTSNGSTTAPWKPSFSQTVTAVRNYKTPEYPCAAAPAST